MTSHRVAILGAGSWGTALAVHLARIGHHVELWARDTELARSLSTERVNTTYLPGIAFGDSIHVGSSLQHTLGDATIVVSAIPSHGCRAVMRLAAAHLHPDATMVSATKGLESNTLLRMSEVIEQEVGKDRPVVVLSGPSFATEVARQMPTAVLAASANHAAATLVQDEFKAPYFRIYASPDVVGVEIGGAMKNVIAIAAGVVEGVGLGHNALAALITRGLAEVTRLACGAGGLRETTAGLSGLGDLVLTCTGDLSRNRRVGIELGRGRSLSEILAGTRMVAEGVKTTHVALALGERYQIELPIATQMAAVLDGRCDVRTAVEALMVRPQRSETDLAPARSASLDSKMH